MMLLANPSASFAQRRQYPFAASDAFATSSSWDDVAPTTTSSSSVSTSITAPSSSIPASAAAPAFTLSPAEANFHFNLDDLSRFQQDSIAVQNYLRSTQPTWQTTYRSAPTTAPRSSGPQQPTRRSVGGESQGNLTPTNWQTFSSHSPVNSDATPVAPQQQQQQQGVKRFGGPLAGHKRSNSGSTIASAGPASPFTPLQSYPHIHDPDVPYGSPLIDSFGDLSPQAGSYGKSLHSGSSTTFTDSYLNPPTYYSQHADPNLAYQAAMRRAMMMPQESSHGSNEAHGSPSLQRQSTGEFDRNFKATVDARRSTPHLDRSLSEVYQDELFDQSMGQPAPASMTRRPTNNAGGSPRSRDVFAERMQAANQSHLVAATTGGASGNVAALAGDRTSPYRLSSEFGREDLASQRMQTVAQLRERQKAASDAYAFAQHRQRTSPRTDEPKTISPQEAFLDGSEMADTTDYGPSLFPHQGFPPTLQRAHSSQASVGTPEFPAQLTSMESTRSEEGVSSNSSYQSQSQTSTLARPAHTATDAGAYACPQPGCTSRFTTAAKLQKHQRDAHRPMTPTSDGEGADSLAQHSPRATAAMLAARNAQAGPHRCERTNPATGRPCNAIFSRPYDLTRHEDTIHNSRRHKVHCPFCADEKTFSRADALTRHLRVVHPERDLPGRRRRQ